MKDIEIRLATIEETHKVMKILNEVTKDLLDKNINQWEYPWNEEVVKEDIVKSKVFFAIYEGIEIATFSIRTLNEENNSFYRELKGGYLYRIAILPRVQGIGIGSSILESIEKDERFNKEDLYLDCWAGNKKLKEFYLKSGFIYIGDYPEDDYKISIYKYKK